MIYEYPVHYLYDLVLVIATLLVINQCFLITASKKTILIFVLFMMLCYQINFYIAIPLIGRPFKYVILLIGFFISYKFVLKLNMISSVLVLMGTVLINSLITNINLLFMLTFIFTDYETALKSAHLQYTCYMFTVLLFSVAIKISKITIIDIERYS